MQKFASTVPSFYELVWTRRRACVSESHSRMNFETDIWGIRTFFLLISLNEKPAKNSYIQKFWKRSANTNAPPIDSYNQSNCSFYFRQQLVVFSANTLQNVKILIGVIKGFCFLFFFWLYSYTKLSIIKSVFEFPGMK